MYLFTTTIVISEKKKALLAAAPTAIDLAMKCERVTHSGRAQALLQLAAAIWVRSNQVNNIY